MATSYNFLHRRSLTLSFVSLVFGGVAFAFLLEFDHRLSESFLSCAAVAASLGLIVCMLTLIHLVRDVGRGYSPTRVQLALVVWLFAFTPIPFLAYQVIQHVDDPRSFYQP